MRKEKAEYAEKQPQVTICKGGAEALVLLNETKKKVTLAAISDDEKSTTTTAYEYDAYWVELTGKDVLTAAKEAVLAKITEYDLSEAVNHFTLNGKKGWLDKATRVGLFNSVNVAKSLNTEKVQIWVGDDDYTMECATAISLLSQIEMYAQDVYNVTATHKKTLESLDNVADVLSYDYTTLYPSPLSLKTE